MGRSSLFDSFARKVRVANFCNRRQIATREGMEIYDSRQQQQSLSRREFLANARRLAAVAAAATVVDPFARVLAAQSSGSQIRVGIVGAGLAGLACARELRRNGIVATLFDANDRVGGRCWSLRGRPRRR